MRLEARRHELPTILKAPTTYFALVFGAGFVLGPIRILFIVPRFGVRVAELIEAPIMLVVIVLAAKWLVRRFSLAGNALPVGFLALSFMIAFEIYDCSMAKRTYVGRVSPRARPGGRNSLLPAAGCIRVHAFTRFSPTSSFRIAQRRKAG